MSLDSLPHSAIGCSADVVLVAHRTSIDALVSIRTILSCELGAPTLVICVPDLKEAARHFEKVREDAEMNVKVHSIIRGV